MRFIYFELHWESSYVCDPTASWQRGSTKKKIIRNVNILQIKPYTNSGGFWSYRHIHSRKDHNNNDTSSFVIDQYWIDLEKYQNSNYIDDNYSYVCEVISELKSLDRNETIDKLISK